MREEEEIQQLMQDVSNGVKAEEELTGFFWEELYRLASRLGFEHEESVDIIHDTVSVLLTKLRRQEFRGDSSLGTFVQRIGRNLCIDRIKKAIRSKSGGNVIHISLDAENNFEANSQLTALNSDPAQHVEQKEIDGMLKQSIDALTDKEEWAVLKLLVKSYDRNEISEMLDIPVERVDKKMYNGKKKIKQYIRQTESIET